MKKLALVLVLLASPALAQQPPPIELTPQDQEEITKHLMEIPAKWSLPILQKLGTLQQQAHRKAEMNEKIKQLPKPEEK